MIIVGNVANLFLKISRNTVNLFNKIHTNPVNTSQNFFLKDEVAGKPSLWLTTLPKESMKNLIATRRKKRKVKENLFPKGPLLISCKNKEFNQYRGTTYKKFDIVPLASKGWHHRKSNGDFFSIFPSRQNPAFLLPSGSKHYKIMGDPNEDEDEFKSLGLSDITINGLKNMNIHYPTTIQIAAIPTILEGKHVLITAETGCGKTLAYVLPMVEHILRWKGSLSKNYNSPYGLIVVPTRELAHQVGDVVSKLIEDMNLTSKVILSKCLKKFLLNLEEDDVEKVDIVVTTPGVICKLTYHGVYSLSSCLHLVIDEADTLMDDSFISKLEILFKRCRFRRDCLVDPDMPPTDVQLSLVSATVPEGRNKVMNEIFPADFLVKISTRYLHKIQPHIRQNFIRCKKSDKHHLIVELVREGLKKKTPMIVFCNNTDTCNWLALYLKENGIECARLNKRMNTDERIWSLSRFRNGEVDVFVCTDIASRGQDIPRIKHVVNYEFPKYMADYVHRCGRTGRISNDQDCQVTSFISKRSEVELLMKIEKSARLNKELPYVNNNITRLIQERCESEL